MESRPRSRSVLVAEGDRDYGRFLTHCLESSGYHVTVAQNAGELLTADLSAAPAVVLVDTALAGSIDAMRRLREASNVVIVVMVFEDRLSGTEGLECGGDALITKPVEKELLIAQVEACLRRASGFNAGPDRFVVRDLVVDYAGRQVTRAGRHVELSVREYALLEALSMNAGRVLSHAQLLRLVWGPGYEEDNVLLRAYVRKLRRKIDDPSRCPALVHTAPQVGYWMERSPR